MRQSYSRVESEELTTAGLVTGRARHITTAQLYPGADVEFIVAEASETGGSSQCGVTVAVAFARILTTLQSHLLVVDKDHSWGEHSLIVITADVGPTLRRGKRVVVLLGNWQNVRTWHTLESGDVETGRRSRAGGLRTSRAPKGVTTRHLGNDVAVALWKRFGELSSSWFTCFGCVDVEVLVQDLEWHKISKCKPSHDNTRTHGAFGDRDRHILSHASRVVQCLGQNLPVPPHDEIRVKTETRRVAVCPRKMTLDVLTFGDCRMRFGVVSVLEQNRGESDGVTDRTGTFSQVERWVGDV